MLAAYLLFDDEVVLVLGVTPNDFRLLSNGIAAPLIDLEALAQATESELPVKIQVVFGVTEDAIQERIGQSLRESGLPGEVQLLSDNQVAAVLDGDPGYEDEARISPAHLAAHTAEELAIKRARARLN